jgi:oligoribonuclease
MLGIFLDIEATGLDFTKHHVIDIAFKLIDLTTGDFKDAYQSIVKQSPQAWSRRDPASIKINGFTWEQILTGKPPKVVADEIIAILDKWHIERGKAVFICQNPSFDRGFFTQLIEPYRQEKLHWPYHWLDLASMYWAILARKNVEQGTPFPSEIALSKNEIAKIYKIPTEKEPHRAMNGVNHLIECYEAVLGVNICKDAVVS